MASTPQVFVYGSLMAPEVLQIVLDRVPRTQAAVLHGYARYQIKHRVYPAIIPSTSDSVDGLLLQDLSSRDLDILCEFEAPEYELLDVQPQVEGGRAEYAQAYVWKDAHRHQLDQAPWSYEEFRQQHLEEYEVMCRRWRSHLNV